jgi:hypothetical protein
MKKKPATGNRKPETAAAPAVHIPRQHQSAPAEHWADKEVRLASDEIRSGQFTPALGEDEFLAASVGMQRGPEIRDPNSLSRGEVAELQQETLDSLALAQHPRVQEALARLEQEKNDARTPEELIEKAQMLHEMTERSARKNGWDGQGRWLGKENEEMRVVNLLTWKQWLDRLGEVIGPERVFVSRYAVGGLLKVVVPNTEYYRSLVIIPGAERMAPSPKEDKFLAVATLQPVNPEWMVMRINEYGEPTCAKYKGWRTALLCLITAKIISEKEAHKAFPLGTGPAGAWYRQQLFELRAREGLVA